MLYSVTSLWVGFELTTLVVICTDCTCSCKCNYFATATTTTLLADNTYCIKYIIIRWLSMLFNATYNNISVISWRSDLLVQETGVPGENNRPAANHWQTLSHNVVSIILWPFCIKYQPFQLIIWRVMKNW